MCGIAGFISPQFNQKNLEKSLSDLDHRGPDEVFAISIPKLKAKLGMTRLAIQDLSKNLYPFSYQDRYTLIYNGEIYNTDQLWEKLKQDKIKPKTNCDAEPILPLFHQYGTKVFNLLQGMFAIVIIDQKLGKMYLARDKFGEKPLYYYYDEQGIYFASELKAFPQKLKSFSPSRIPDYLSFGFLPDNKTFFNNIFKLKAGEFLEYDCRLNYLKTKYYYQLSDDLEHAPRELNKKQLKNDLETVVRGKLISDVPVGTFLSGGLDSSLITGIAKKYHHNDLHTFSVQFPGSTYDESDYSSYAAKKIGTKHHLISVTSPQVKKIWPEFIKKLDQPASDPALIPTFFLAKIAKKHVTVILSGEGMDEIFSGYPRYERELKILAAKKKIPSLINQIAGNYFLSTSNYKLFSAFSQYSDHYTATFLNTQWLMDKKHRTKYVEKIKKSWFDLFTYLQDFDEPQSETDILKIIQLYDLHYYVAEQLCMKLDSMTMFHSVEGRAPYLDSTLLKYLPLATQKSIDLKKSKAIVREIAADFIPADIAQRPKHGFTVPLDNWLSEDLSFAIDQLVNQPHEFVLKYVHPETITLLLKMTMQGDVGSSMSLWSIIILDQWLKTHLK